MLYTAEIKKAGFGETNSILEIELQENILEKLKRHKTKVLEIAIPDNCLISRDQQKKAYATINDIADWEYYIKGIEPDDNFDFADVTDRNQSDLKIIGNVFEDGDLLNDSE